MIFLYDGKFEEQYEHINITILDVNIMNMPVINMDGNYGDIDDDDSTCHG